MIFDHAEDVQRCTHARRPLLLMLGDSSWGVRRAAVADLAATLAQFGADGTVSEEARAKSGAELAAALLDVDAGAGLDWRLQQGLLAAFPPLAHVRLAFQAL
jgi:hypothetical protein